MDVRAIANNRVLGAVVTAALGYIAKGALARWGILDPYIVKIGEWLKVAAPIDVTVNAIGLFVFLVLYAGILFFARSSRGDNAKVDKWLSRDELLALVGTNSPDDVLIPDLINGALIAKGFLASAAARDGKAVIISADEWRFLHLDCPDLVAFADTRHGGDQYIGVTIGRAVSTWAGIGRLVRTVGYVGLFLVGAAVISILGSASFSFFGVP